MNFEFFIIRNQGNPRDRRRRRTNDFEKKLTTTREKKGGKKKNITVPPGVIMIAEGLETVEHSVNTDPKEIRGRTVVVKKNSRQRK